VTRGEIRAFLAGCDSRAAREGCGITQASVIAALGCSRSAVGRWERGQVTPAGSLGARYCRIVAGFLRHLEVTW
jgi:DNA-binding XRE family transcriptional regulator